MKVKITTDTVANGKFVFAGDVIEVTAREARKIRNKCIELTDTGEADPESEPEQAPESEPEATSRVAPAPKRDARKGKSPAK